MTDAKTPETDPGAERRETYRLARRAYIQADEACKHYRHVLQRALDTISAAHSTQWPPVQTMRQMAPPPMPHEAPQPKPHPMALPSDADLHAAIQRRSEAQTAIKNAWNAMSRAEQDECATPPEALNLQRKY